MVSVLTVLDFNIFSFFLRLNLKHNLKLDVVSLNLYMEFEV